MGSAYDAINWLREGYEAGDPIRTSLFIVIGATLLTINTISGGTF